MWAGKQIFDSRKITTTTALPQLSDSHQLKNFCFQKYWYKFLHPNHKSCIFVQVDALWNRTAFEDFLYHCIGEPEF